MLKKTPRDPDPDEARKKAIRAVERLFKRFGLNAKESAHYDQLRAIVLESGDLDEPRKRRRGAPKKWTRDSLLMLGFLWGIVTHGGQPMTMTLAAARIRKFCTTCEAFQDWASMITDDRSIARRLPKAIRILEHRMLFYRRHPRLRARVDAILEERERTTN